MNTAFLHFKGAVDELFDNFKNQLQHSDASMHAEICSEFDYLLDFAQNGTSMMFSISENEQKKIDAYQVETIMAIMPFCKHL